MVPPPQPHLRRRAALVVINPSGNRAKVLIESSPFTIGRLSDNHLTLRDNRISRAHARIVYDGGYYVEDLHSRHGVFVNSEKVERQLLHSSDRIEFGFDDSYKVLFLFDDDEIGRLLQQIQTGHSLVSGGANLTKLRAMVEVARTLQHSLAANEVLAAVLDAALTITGTTRGYMLLRTDGRLAVRVSRDSSGMSLDGSLPGVSLAALELALVHRREFLTLTVPLDDGQTALTVPLVRVRAGTAEETHIVSTGDNTVGLLFLEGGKPDMSEGSGELLQTLALEASTVLENARLLEEEREKQRIDEELTIARQIQQSLLPSVLPHDGWFRAAGSSAPSHKVGGDYFDIRLIAEGCWSVVVADVSGKGVSSAILASLLQGAFLSASSDASQMPDLIGHINRYVLERAKGEKYATILYALVDESGLLSWINAGHCTPIIVHADGRSGILETSGLPVGMIERAQFSVHQMQLQPKDKIILYSDGVTDAQNLEGKFFGAHRIQETVQSLSSNSCQEMHDGLSEALRNFTEGGVASDDITIVVLEYLPHTPA